MAPRKRRPTPSLFLAEITCDEEAGRVSLAAGQSAPLSTPSLEGQTQATVSAPSLEGPAPLATASPPTLEGPAPLATVSAPSLEGQTQATVSAPSLEGQTQATVSSPTLATLPPTYLADHTPLATLPPTYLEGQAPLSPPSLEGQAHAPWGLLVSHTPHNRPITLGAVVVQWRALLYNPLETRVYHCGTPRYMEPHILGWRPLMLRLIYFLFLRPSLMTSMCNLWPPLISLWPPLISLWQQHINIFLHFLLQRKTCCKSGDESILTTAGDGTWMMATERGLIGQLAEDGYDTAATVPC
ncbi:unnamed protein product [Boreogadus saida]